MSTSNGSNGCHPRLPTVADDDDSAVGHDDLDGARPFVHRRRSARPAFEHEARLIGFALRDDPVADVVTPARSKSIDLRESVVRAERR